MKRSTLRRRAETARPKTARDEPSRSSERPTGLSRDRQPEAAVAGRPCTVCGATHRIDPAHLIPGRSAGAATLVLPLCRRCHRAYDNGELDLLPHLEPAWRAQLAHAVGHVGLIGALRRISGAAAPAVDALRRRAITGRASPPAQAGS